MNCPHSSIRPEGSDNLAGTAADTVDRFLRALSRYDFDELENCLAPNVWFRALLPKSLHESKTSTDTADAYRSWYGDKKRYRVLALEHSTLPGRESLRYRFLVLPPWAPDEWHVIEQSGLCRVKDGRISRLDVVCTGFHPAREEPVATPTTDEVA